MTQQNEENMQRLSAARQTISNNPETQLVNAAAAGDAPTVQRLLEHVYDLPRNRIAGDKFIMLRNEAYGRAFAAAANNFHCDITKKIIDYAGHKLPASTLWQPLYRAAKVDPDENPDAEDMMNYILDHKEDAIPTAMLEAANRLRTAYNEDLDRAKHIRENFDQFISFYTVKEETTARAMQRDPALQKLTSVFEVEDKSKQQKKPRPDYIRPVK